MQPNNAMSSQGAISLSIVIRTFNSAKTIRVLLDHLGLQSEAEVIIIDSGSSDQTPEIVSHLVSKVLQPLGPFHYSKALNIGFSQALAPWVLVISSHCIPTSSDFLENILRFTRSANPSCVVGYGKVNVVSPKTASLEIIGNQQAFECGKFFPGGNGLAVYRRSAWEAHQFDEGIDTAEDLEWFLWAIGQGFTAHFIPGASAIYLNQGSLAHMFRKGWLEVRRTRALIPYSRRNLSSMVSGLALNYAYYPWLALRLKIPVSTMFRQCAHSLGAFLAELFPLKP
jgi:glycosyltransferase involved in cell wall biosynthesis